MSDTVSPSRIQRHVLSDGDVSVAILSLGCITQDWRVPLGAMRVPVVLGYERVTDYLANPCYLGVIAGRVANRTAQARFTLSGRNHSLSANEGAHHLHGGRLGLGRRNWRIEPDGAKAVQLRLTSPDGDQGYPGRLDLCVTITLGGHTLRYDLRAKTDRPTPVSLAQHSYYNLQGGAGPITDHVAQVEADRYTPVDAQMIATGAVRPLDGQPFDLRAPRRLAEADPAATGLDLNYALRGSQDRPAARVSAPNGMTLEIVTDQPGLQLYTGSGLRRAGTPLTGQTHEPFTGLCLEPQGFPNSVNIPQFPSILVDPDHPYHQTLGVRIAPEATT